MKKMTSVSWATHTHTHTHTEVEREREESKHTIRELGKISSGLICTGIPEI